MPNVVDPISNLKYGFIALIVCWIITIVQLLTTKYPRTYFLLTPKKCPSLYIYGLIYGLMALGVITIHIVPFDRIGISDPWLQAIFIGAFLKAFFQVRIFSIPIGNELTGGNQEPKSFPVGLETVVTAFEPWFLRTIRTDEYDAREEFLAPYLRKYTDPDEIHRKIRLNTPRDWTKLERAGLELSLQASAKATDDPLDKAKGAMDAYLRAMGKRSFQRVFSLSTDLSNEGAISPLPTGSH